MKSFSPVVVYSRCLKTRACVLAVICGHETFFVDRFLDCFASFL